jgi:hypothetical protein
MDALCGDTHDFGEQGAVLFSAPRDDTARASYGNGAKANSLFRF